MNKNIYRPGMLLIAAAYLSACCGCSRDHIISDKVQLQRVITSYNSDRSERFSAIETALVQYPTEADDWLGAGLLNTPDSEVADFFIEKLSGISTDVSVIYLSRYAGKYPSRHEQIKAICQNISKEPFPAYLLRLVNSERFRAYRSDSFEQLDLWNYLCDHMSKDELGNWLAENKANNPLLEDLQYYHNEFGYIPMEKGELLVSRQILDELKGNTKLHEQINNLRKKGYDFSIADYGLLRSLPGSLLYSDRLEMIKEIQKHLENTRHISRMPAYRNAANDITDDFDKQANRLNDIDLLRVLLLCRAIYEDQDFSPKLHSKYANSEIGGLCFWQDYRLKLTEYAPGRQAGDHLYIESAKLLADVTSSIARWHIHDQIASDKDIAGPGQDDMKYALQMRTNIVVITAISNAERKTLYNFDLLTSQGNLIDLGCVLK